MAVSNSAVVTPGGIAITPFTNIVTFTVIATADADTGTGNIAHGLSYVPDFWIITPILAAGALKGWSVTTSDATNFVLTGSNVVGSGNAGAQIRFWGGRLHTIIR